MNIEVDNEILASVIDARFGIKPQLSSNIEKANFKQTIFFPEDKLKSNTFNSVPLDTYGIINKSKLFTIKFLNSSIYSTVTDFAKFLG